MMLNWIISSSLLILAVIALRFALRGRMSPVASYLLWGLVLLRLLVPVSVMHVPYSAASLVESTQLSQDLERLEQVDAVKHADDGSVLGVIHDGALNIETGERVDTQTIVDYNADEATFQHWQRTSALKNFAANILLPLWLVGIVLVAAWFIAVNAVFSRRLRRTRQRLDCDCPRPVYLSEAVETPCLHGLLFPAVYVTPAVAADETALRHVLAHELSHYRHRDHIWGIFRAAVLALHWYNPLVWWAAALSRRDGELACDESAIESLGESQRTDYGRTLIGLSCRSARPNDLILTATTMTGGKRTLKERIVLIAKKPQTKTAAVFLVAVIAIFAAVFAFAGSLPLGESSIRHSAARMNIPAWRFHFTEDITDVYIRVYYYRDGESVIISDCREDAKYLRGITLDVGWEDIAENKFRIDTHYTKKPHWGLFAAGYGLHLEEDTQLITDLDGKLGEGFEAACTSWSNLQLREPLVIKKGDSVPLMGIYFGDIHFMTNPIDKKLPPDIEKKLTSYIIIDAYFE